ncbi:hypothetical protein quinque_001732 [Culex quinquefasciatus]
MVAPRDRKLLQLFHLRQINNATFITYVYPLLMLIRRLVYKRGFVKHRNSRIPKLRAAYKLQCVVDQINTGPGSKSVGKEDKQFEVTNFWRTTLRAYPLRETRVPCPNCRSRVKRCSWIWGFPR